MKFSAHERLSLSVNIYSMNIKLCVVYCSQADHLDDSIAVHQNRWQLSGGRSYLGGNFKFSERVDVSSEQHVREES